MMLKKFVASLPILTASLLALSGNANGQTAPTVAFNGLGSSALFLEAGLAASSPTAGIGATCVWSSRGAAGAVVTATDTSAGSLTDSGNAWVAWTPGSGGCTDIGASTTVWAYLQTDSVVGNRCLFNGSACTIAYPVNAAGVPTASPVLISSSEVPLPSAIASALNASAVTAAGTDIRPEDAEFAIARAQAPCGQAINSTSYLGLGYANGSQILGVAFGSAAASHFNVINFSLPSSFTVTPIGATPIVVAVNGFSGINDISSQNLALFLDGTNSWTGQANGNGATGSPVTVLIREPLSGTYNTMEYNVPNTVNSTFNPLGNAITGNFTSQDVGQNQLVAQMACNNGSPVNPLNIATVSGGARKRAIGTGQELNEVLDTTNNGSNIIGYSFWSAANFAPFAGSTTTHYLTVDGIDPLHATAVANNPIPTAAADLQNVTLSNVANGSYPIWSLIRFVTVNSTATTNAQTLAMATQKFTTIGAPNNTRPDFITTTNLTVVRSHFLPPAGVGQPAAASIANGRVGLPTSACSKAEAGGDVGGVVITLTGDSATCTTPPTLGGQTGHRR
jgi:hypothetical protein